MNYPLTFVGVMNAGLQFRLLAVGFSNKEDSIMYESLVRHAEQVIYSRNLSIAVECTHFDYSTPIQTALQSVYPNATLGNCLLYLLQNNKRKRESWNLSDQPPNLTLREQTTWRKRRKDDLEYQGKEIIDWLSTIPD